MTLPQLERLVNDTAADAIPVDANFQAIRDHVNTELIDRDGSVQMTGPLVLSTGRAAVDSMIVPVGAMMDWPALAAPSGWALCNGAVLNSATYADLYALIGSTYNLPGDSFDGLQFRLPNLAGLVVVSAGGGFTLAATGGTADAVVVEHTHVATASEDLHDHTGDDLRNTFIQVQSGTGSEVNTGTTSGTVDPDTHDHAITVESTGVDGTNQNLQPYIVLNKIIKVV